MKTGQVPRGRRWMTVIVVGIGLASVMVAGQPSPAAAAATPGSIGYQVFTEDSPDIGSESIKTAEATCPAGKELIGAGGHISGGGEFVLLKKIVPDPNTETVTVSAREGRGGTSKNWRVRAVAVCVNTGLVPGIYTVEEVKSDDGNSIVSNIALCNGNDQVLSVGFSLSGAARYLHLTTLMPLDNRDGVSVVARENSTGTSTAWEVTAIALCAPLSPSQAVLHSNTGNATAGPAAVTVTSCPEGFLATTGGGSIDPDPGAENFVTLTDFFIATIDNSTPDGVTGYTSVSSIEPAPEPRPLGPSPATPFAPT